MTTETHDVVVVGADSASRHATPTLRVGGLDVVREDGEVTGAAGRQDANRTRPRAGAHTDAEHTRGTTDGTAVDDRLAHGPNGASPRSATVTDAVESDHV